MHELLDTESSPVLFVRPMC